MVDFGVSLLQIVIGVVAASAWAAPARRRPARGGGAAAAAAAAAACAAAGARAERARAERAQTQQQQSLHHMLPLFLLLLCVDGNGGGGPADGVTGEQQQQQTAVRILLPKVVSSYMVLQAERPSLSGWTSAADYAAVRAVFHDASTGRIVVAISHPTNSSTVAPNATSWTVDLPPQNASLQSVDIVLTLATASGGGATSPLVLREILFGDVYLCTGQSTFPANKSAHIMLVLPETDCGLTCVSGFTPKGSIFSGAAGAGNMEFAAAEMFGASAVMAAASNMPGGLRLFAVQKNGSATRLPDIKESQYGARGWVVSSPKTVCGAEYGRAQDYCEPHCAYSPDPRYNRQTWGFFSAVCLVHGMRILNETGRPQGLIESAWGGSEIELWQSSESRAQCPSTWCPGQPGPAGRCLRDGLYYLRHTSTATIFLD
jgi:hypothetical protein